MRTNFGARGRVGRVGSVAWAALMLAGCGGGGDNAGPGGPAAADSGYAAIGYSFPAVAGKYTVLGILTDNKDQSRAKTNAEDTLSKHPDVACMVGLWAYNPPAIYGAVKAVGKQGQIQIVAFDEHEETLQAIADGHMHGTIVQQPFAFGFKSVEYLAAIARGQEVKVPATGKIHVPHTVIKKDNVEAFLAEVQRMKAGNGTLPTVDRDDYKLEPPVKLAFLTNSVDPFWVLAGEGVKLGNKNFAANCEFHMPTNGTVEEQKRFIEDQISQGCQGLAISPIDPANQGEIINKACEKMTVICQDSDAPNTQRKFYLGTSNYVAGRAAGKLVKEALPEGGKVMIFVGKMEVLNAQERSKGLIDELADKPLPPEFAAAE